MFSGSIYIWLLFWIQGVDGEYKGVHSPTVAILPQGVDGEYKGVHSPISRTLKKFMGSPRRRGRIVFQDIGGGPVICHGFTGTQFCFLVIAFTLGWVACFLWLLFGSGE